MTSRHDEHRAGVILGLWLVWIPVKHPLPPFVLTLLLFSLVLESLFPNFQLRGSRGEFFPPSLSSKPSSAPWSGFSRQFGTLDPNSREVQEEEGCNREQISLLLWRGLFLRHLPLWVPELLLIKASNLRALTNSVPAVAQHCARGFSAPPSLFTSIISWLGLGVSFCCFCFFPCLSLWGGEQRVAWGWGHVPPRLPLCPDCPSSALCHHRWVWLWSWDLSCLNPK